MHHDAIATGCTVALAVVFDKAANKVHPDKPCMHAHIDSAITQLMGEDEDSYRLTTGSIPDDTAFTSIPCGKCPVFGECKEGGPISPQTCVYYQEWLKF